MVKVFDKKMVEIVISKIPRPQGLKKRLEQYPTPSWIVAHMSWRAFMNGDVEGRSVADLGCGDGRFLYASFLLGAKLGLCVDIDEEAVKHALSVLNTYFSDYSPRAVFIVGDASQLSFSNVDTVVMNPPFGVVRENRGLDIAFLKKALQYARSVYSIHKYSPGLLNILKDLADSYNSILELTEILDFEIPMIFETHRSRIYRFKSLFIVLRRVIPGEQC
uniref:Methyltransferase domain-containing protein n=1 Tax=Thermosphaera aggregans TaxID=54254 RepID=A0A7C2BKG6_9CREN